MYLKTFSAKDYKNFNQKLSLEDIGQVSIVHGNNNIGKSNLLESIVLFSQLLAFFSEKEIKVQQRTAPPEHGRLG